MPKTKVAYPEHEKMAAVKDQSQTIGEFLDWLRYEKDLTICQDGIMDERPVYWTRETAKEAGLKWAPFGRDPEEGEVNDFVVREYEQYERSGFYPAGIRIEDMLAEFFNIDLKKIEMEKRAMLATLRQQHYGDEPLGV